MVKPKQQARMQRTFQEPRPTAMATAAAPASRCGPGVSLAGPGGVEKGVLRGPCVLPWFFLGKATKQVCVWG